MNNPQVSIILPTYNRAKYLEKAVESVIAQDFSNWELIIWNDGSNDDTESIVQSFVDKRIRYYSESNHGKCYALNNAIKQARGEWIAILDDDDLWLPHKLETQMNFLFKFPNLTILFSNFINTNLTTGEKGIGFEQNQKGLKLLEVEEVQEGLFLIKNNLLQGMLSANFILPSSTMIHKSVFSIVGYFNETLRNSEDLELWFRIYLHGFAFAFTKMILVDRIKPAGSLSSPSVVTCLHHLAALDTCFHEAERNQRLELLSFFRPAYQSAWQGLIRQYAQLGKRKNAFQAFQKSINYGLTWRSIYLLLGALAGPFFIKLIGKPY